jgi:LacI family transcriptional regulator
VSAEMAREKKISMQKIADELGISKVTVSKALNHKEGVGEALKERILEKAAGMGYILPDYGERRTMKVAIIMSNRFTTTADSGKFYMSMYEKIVTELRKLLCSTIMLTPGSETVDLDLETVTKQELVDGIILLGILDKKVLEKVDQIALPKVYVDVYDLGHQSDSVISENIYSTYEMTEYLIRMGHTKIGFVGTIGATTSILDRYLGYQRALLENGLRLQTEWIINDRTIDGEAIELRLPKEMPTAFVCNCDETAFRLIRVLKTKDFLVPQDISLVSFDDDIYAELCEPKLTTVAVNVEQIGRVTAKRMIRNMKEPKKSHESFRREGEVYRIPGKIIFRDSVRDLKRRKKEEHE